MKGPHDARNLWLQRAVFGAKETQKGPLSRSPSLAKTSNGATRDAKLEGRPHPFGGVSLGAARSAPPKYGLAPARMATCGTNELGASHTSVSPRPNPSIVRPPGCPSN